MQQTGTSMMSGTEHMSTRTTERQAQSLPTSRSRIPTRAMALSTRTTKTENAILAHEPYPQTNRAQCAEHLDHGKKSATLVHSNVQLRNSTVVCTSRPAPVVAPQRACPSPCQRTATAEPPLFTAMLDQGTCVAQQRACQPPCSRSDFSTSGPEHLPGTTTGMSTLLVQEVWT